MGFWGGAQPDRRVGFHEAACGRAAASHTLLLLQVCALQLMRGAGDGDGEGVACGGGGSGGSAAGGKGGSIGRGRWVAKSGGWVGGTKGSTADAVEMVRGRR